MNDYRILPAAFALLYDLPDDGDGINRWYWEIGITPLGYVCEIWKVETDKWRVGERYIGKAKHLYGAIVSAIYNIPQEIRNRE